MRTRFFTAISIALVTACAAPSTPQATDQDDPGDETDDADATDVTTLGRVLPGIAVTLGGHPAWLHFSNPAGAADGVDHTILAETIRLIDDAPPGATIRAAVHSLVVNGVQRALVDAKQRGVTVRMVEDGSDQFDADDSPRILAAALGADHVFCGDGKQGGDYGCTTSDKSGIMHTKLFTFSQTKDPNGAMRNDVVWFGSANMTYATGAKTFNNTVTIYGDAGLYGTFGDYFRDLFAQRHSPHNDYYDAASGRGYYASATARVYTSPEQDGDLVYNRLNDIDAGSSCTVRVIESMIHDARPALVDLLVRLKKGGCTVRVIASNVESGSLAKFHRAHIPVLHSRVHDKLVLVDARFAGSSDNRQLVFTGSHNWTTSANSKNDELFVRLEGDAVHAAYLRHWGDAYGAGSPL